MFWRTVQMPKVVPSEKQKEREHLSLWFWLNKGQTHKLPESWTVSKPYNTDPTVKGENITGLRGLGTTSNQSVADC